MKIALFSDTYLPTVNGVARTLGKLVEHAGKRGYEVGLITTTVPEIPAEGTAFHHQLPGVPLPMYPELQLARPLDKAGQERLEAFQPDLVHVATESIVGWSGRAWAQRNGVPLVTSFHTDWPAYLAGYGFGGLESTAWRILQAFHAGAPVTFCPSSSTLTQLRDRGFTQDLRIWGRGVDTDLFRPSRRSEELRRALAPESEKIVMYVGRLAPEKRLDVLLQAYPLVRGALGDRVVLALVGDGPWMKRLRKRRPDGVFLLGYRTGIHLAEAYASGDVFAFPSDTETFGNVVTEALASGLPVIAPEKGGVQDSVIPGRNGILVPPRDPRAMAREIIRLLENEDERTRLAAGARDHALSQTWETIFDGLFSGYEEAVAVGLGAMVPGRWGDTAA